MRSTRRDVGKIARGIASKLKACIGGNEDTQSYVLLVTSKNKLTLDYPFKSVNRNYKYLDIMEDLRLICFVGSKGKEDCRLTDKARELYLRLKEEGYYSNHKKAA